MLLTLTYTYLFHVHPRKPFITTDPAIQLKDYGTGSKLSMTWLALRGTAMSNQYPGDKLHTASTARTPSSHERLNSSSHERLNSCTQTLEGTQVLYVSYSLYNACEHSFVPAMPVAAVTVPSLPCIYIIIWIKSCLRTSTVSSPFTPKSEPTLAVRGDHVQLNVMA